MHGSPQQILNTPQYKISLQFVQWELQQHMQADRHRHDKANEHFSQLT